MAGTKARAAESDVAGEAATEPAMDPDTPPAEDRTAGAEKDGVPDDLAPDAAARPAGRGEDADEPSTSETPATEAGDTVAATNETGDPPTSEAADTSARDDEGRTAAAAAAEAKGDPPSRPRPKARPGRKKPAPATAKARSAKGSGSTGDSGRTVRTVKTARPHEKAAARRPRDRKAPLSRLSDPMLNAAAALAVIALVSAIWFGASWYGARNDDSRAYSRLREEVLRSGEQAIQNMNTLDYRAIDSSLKTWQDSSTAELYQQVVQGRAKLEQDVTKSRTVSSAKILEATLTELDDHAGKAGIIAAVRVTVTPPKGRASSREVRLSGQLTKTSSGWKLSALGQAPTGTSGS